MEITTTGKVMVAAKIESPTDLYKVKQGVTPADQVRTVDVIDAVVDTGATILSSPKRLIEQLELERYRTRPFGRWRESSTLPSARRFG